MYIIGPFIASIQGFWLFLIDEYTVLSFQEYSIFVGYMKFHLLGKNTSPTKDENYEKNGCAFGHL